MVQWIGNWAKKKYETGAILSCIFPMLVATIWRDRNRIRFQEVIYNVDRICREIFHIRGTELKHCQVGRLPSIFTLKGLSSSTVKLSLAISVRFPDCCEEIRSCSAGRNYWLFLTTFDVSCFGAIVRLHVMLNLVL